MTQKEIIYGLIKSEQPIKIMAMQEKTGMLYNSINKCVRDLWFAGSIKETLDGWVLE